MAEIATGTTARPIGYIEWGSIIAGALTAAAISFVLYVFGVSIGLSSVSPWPNSGLSSGLVAALAVFWALASQIGSFLVGGYIAGRMRPTWDEASREEVEFRDGLHGLLVWALGVVIGAAILLTAAGSALKSGAEVGARAAAPAASDLAGYYSDTLLRPGTQAAPAAGATAGTDAATQAEVQRIIARSLATGSVAEPDRAYLYQIVARRTGLSAEEAQRRVDQTIANARDGADKARKAGVLAGLVTGLSLIISLAAAWWAAQQGGNHRDRNTNPTLFRTRYFPVAR